MLWSCCLVQASSRGFLAADRSTHTTEASKISAIWDSVIEILNHYYGFDFPADLRLRTNVFHGLKDKKPELLSIFNEIQNNKLYIAAQRYRTAAAHGTSAGSVTNTVKVEKDALVDILEKDADGNLILDENGVVKMKKVKAKRKISETIGDYTNVVTIMENMESYAIYTGEQIQKIIETIRKELIPFNYSHTF